MWSWPLRRRQTNAGLTWSRGLNKIDVVLATPDTPSFKRRGRVRASPQSG
jgi:hypothetical protein